MPGRTDACVATSAASCVITIGTGASGVESAPTNGIPISNSPNTNTAFFMGSLLS